MATLVRDILKGYLRYALFGVGVWMVDRGIATPDQIEQLIGGLALAILALGWMAITKVQERLKLDVALSLPSWSTEDELNARLRRL